jgi:hypothetical protein
MDKILKVIVKAGLKAFAPVVGELAVDVAEAGAEQFLDAKEKANADDIAGRLLQRLEAATQAWRTAEGVDAGSVEAALLLAQRIASSPQSLLGGWADADFDPRRAAEKCITQDRGSAAAEGPERDACLMVLTALFEGLSAESKALESTEARFRRQVLSALSDQASTLQRVAGAGRDVFRAAAAAALGLPMLRWTKDLSPPGALLRADLDDPVPFHGRVQELKDLERWCLSDVPISLRVYSGRGGVGKTRLLRELCTRMRGKGIRTGMLDRDLPSEPTDLWDSIVSHSEPTLVVIDYAETRRGQVVAILAALVRRYQEGGLSPWRVVLIARAADEWWSRLRQEAAGVGELLRGPQGSVHRLGSAADTSEDRLTLFGAAATHFAAKLGMEAPAAPALGALDGEEYETTLLLQTAALAAVDGVAVEGDQGILDYILDRERRFWRERAAVVGLSEAVVRGFGRAMAAVTLMGGVNSARDAAELLGRIDFFAAETLAIREQVAAVLHETYPGDDWIEPLVPDLLGEHLCQQEFADPAVAEQVMNIALGGRVREASACAVRN